jgi:penicillin-binding protein 2
MLLESLFPSLFARRMLLLAVALSAAGIPLAAQLTRLTGPKHDDLLAQAEQRLVRRQWTPTIRGRILDRNARVLAQDRPSYDIVVAYPVITGQWAHTQAGLAARRAVGAGGWANMSPADRDELTARFFPVYQAHLERGWDRLAATAGVPRAHIDAQRDAVYAAVTSRHAALIARRVEIAIEEAKAKGQPLTDAQTRAVERRASQPIAEMRMNHALITRVDDNIGFECAALAGDETVPDASLLFDDSLASALTSVAIVPGMDVIDSGERDYPYESISVAVNRASLPSPISSPAPLHVWVEGVACHILGHLRDRVSGDWAGVPGDASRRRAFFDANPAAAREAFTSDGEDRGAYREGDRIGDAGVEAMQEHTLRGLRGVKTTRLDTRTEDILPARPGSDVTLTLDVLLQARVQALMSPEMGLATIQPWQGDERQRPTGTPLFGAAVVLDVDTAEILALVSTPTYTRRQLREDPRSIFGDEVATAHINRAIAKPYPPGSVVKAAVLAGAVTNGNYNPDSRIACGGHLLPNRPDIYRCLIYKRYSTTHSIVLGRDLDGADAVMVSCNVFFFTMGRRMGVEGIVPFYRSLGVGEPFDLGIGPEFRGQLGSSQDGSDLALPDAIQMAIGQGPVAWTPLHAADVFATLARAGVRRPPVIVNAAMRDDPRDLAWNSRAVSQAMEGLRLAVNGERGTGRTLTIDARQEPIFNAPGVKVWGKTGTAEAPPILGIDPDGPDGPLKAPVLEEGDHSWFVILAGRDRPRYAIAVVIDYGGSGGKVSGPITNQIIHALIAEGYL